MEINETKTKERIEKNQYFETINKTGKTDKPLTRLIRGKKKERRYKLPISGMREMALPQIL